MGVHVDVCNFVDIHFRGNSFARWLRNRICFGLLNMTYAVVRVWCFFVISSELMRVCLFLSFGSFSVPG